MARSLADGVDRGHLTGTREELKKLREKEAEIPRVDPEVARELRAVLRGMSKDQREHTVRSSLNFELASAVLNAPGAGDLGWTSATKGSASCAGSSTIRIAPICCSRLPTTKR